MRIFVINGFAGAGKTTFGSFVKEHLLSQNRKFLHTSSIDPIKEILKSEDNWINIPEEAKGQLRALKSRITTVDWDGETKANGWRDKMSELKALINEQFPNFIHEFCLKRSTELGKDGILFVDIREPEQIDAFKSYVLEIYPDFEFKTLIVKGPPSKEYSNKSDRYVDEYVYDIEIDNTDRTAGLESLQELAQEFITQHCLSESDSELDIPLS